MTYLLNGNALHLPLADKSVHCVVTSPPYWGLRDYGTADQLGLEPTPAEYVANTLAWAREVWRVLRDDGTFWLNLGDSYYNYRPGSIAQSKQTIAGHIGAVVNRSGKRGLKQKGLKEKDLCGIPWRVAFALQDDGWYLRSDIIWHKPNPMPESVTDRPTKAHEYIFLLTKSKKYYYDAEAIKEASKPSSEARLLRGVSDTHKNLNVPGQSRHSMHNARPNGEGYHVPPGRNKRSVWTVTTKPYKGSHFATFPPDLIEPCIKAGTSKRGVCPECGNPWVRITENKPMVIERSYNHPPELRTRTSGAMKEPPTSKTIGWKPTCNHVHEPTRAIVFDPFAGSGTTLMVARNLGRVGVGVDLSHEYLTTCAIPRLELDKAHAWQYGAPATTTTVDDLPLFGIPR